MTGGSKGGNYWDSIGRSKQEILNVHRRVAREQGALQRVIGQTGRVLASPGFFVAVFLLHAGWVVVNLPAVSPFPPFDPPPYMLLATIASVEAPFLALLILMRQQRDRKIDELRSETALQVSLHAERETSALVGLVSELCRRLEVETDLDPGHLQAMREPLDARHLFEELRHHLEEIEKDEGTHEKDPSDGEESRQGDRRA
ncbi:MAG TPA: DUF1003 domain-containing protein [Thermoanaerobaculia bacterium]|nr:DUF1003 domain-containing protein [Thermoanaerobaculia bacterium]